jgi:hypothetical protein
VNIIRESVVPRFSTSWPAFIMRAAWQALAESEQMIS